jgi:polyisoprenoid-binding protein YceI
MRQALLLSFLLVGTVLAATAARPSSAVGGPPSPTPRAGSYQVDPAHSGMLFRIGHLGVSNFWGRINGVSGSFELADKAADCSVEITIDATSVDTASEGRDKHIRGPEFFNVVEYPEITFVSKRIAVEGDTYTIEGELTLVGETRPVTIPMTKIGEANTPMGARCGFEGEFSLDRTDFGISALKGPLGTEIRVILFIEAIKQK